MISWSHGLPRRVLSGAGSLYLLRTAPCARRAFPGDRISTISAPR
jgi:hypothetical protein